MYTQHFGLAQYPFSLTPNTHYYLKLPCHQTAFNLFTTALQNDSGFAKITGEMGAGKTMLCHKMLNAMQVHKNRYVTAHIPHPIMTEQGFMRALAEELCFETKTDINYYDLLKLLTKGLLDIFQEDKSVIIFIDEAQSMPEATLEAIRLLTTIDSGHDSRLQVILFGQGELDKLLEQPIFTGLKHNLSFSFKLPALDRESMKIYVEHRLMKAGYNGSHMLSEGALDLLWKTSQGIPRMVNILAHKALLVAYGKADQVVTEEHVFSAILNTESVKLMKSSRGRIIAG